MKYLSILGIFVFFLLLLSCSQGDRKITIGYVQITQDEVLNYAKEGVFAALRDSGFIDGQNIKVIDNNANGDLSMIPTIMQSLQSQGVDLIVTNSTPCMVAAAQMITNIPVVFTVAFSPEQVGMKNTPQNLYGIYDPLDVEKFVLTLLECLPELKRVGLPFNNAEPNAEYSAKMLLSEFEKHSVEVVTGVVNSPNDLTMVSQYLAGQNIGAFVAAADNTVYMGLNVLSKVAADSDIPLFVTDPHQARKGAAIGIGVNYHQWGYLSGLKAVELLKDRNIVTHIEPIVQEELLINRKACKEQGLLVPEEIYSRATTVL